MIRNGMFVLALFFVSFGLTGCGGADVSDGVSKEKVGAGPDDELSEEMIAGEEEAQVMEP